MYNHFTVSLRERPLKGFFATMVHYWSDLKSDSAQMLTEHTLLCQVQITTLDLLSVVQ